MEKTQNKRKMDINTKAFIKAIIIILALMLISYALTFFIDSGTFERDAETGKIVAGSYQTTDASFPVWKFLLSPVLVLGAEGSGTLIAVIAFLLIIGGVFEALRVCGLMNYMLGRITARFAAKRYLLMAVIMLFFMSLGSLIGSFEECVPLVPIVVALAVGLGWDALTGIGMSLLSVGCGFAAGVFNPFTVGVAQEIAGLPMFSGWWLRLLSFVLIYFLLLLFIRHHAKKVERPVDVEILRAEFVKDPKKEKGMFCFAGIMGAGILLVLLSGVITVLQDYTLIIVALVFLIAGIVSPALCGMKPKLFLKSFLTGMIGMLPAVLMILMASSIKYILEESLVLDTILFGAVGVAEKLPAWTIILFIYALALVMEFFVASGSAKAFMMMPLIVPLAEMFGISAQLCVVAYAFGDGFSNVLYPTNPALLISLGLVDVEYGKWFRWSGVFQLMNLLLTSGILLLGYFVGYC